MIIWRARTQPWQTCPSDPSLTHRTYPATPEHAGALLTIPLQPAAVSGHIKPASGASPTRHSGHPTSTTITGSPARLLTKPGYALSGPTPDQPPLQLCRDQETDRHPPAP